MKNWSLTHVNDPSVIFNEAGYEYNGNKYPFMMHYTTTSGDNTGNVIGVAYSKDGVKWERYDKPVIKPLNEGHIAHDGKLSYGVGQTSALKLPDGRTLVMYTDLTRERADGYDGRIVISSTICLQRTL